MTVLVALFIFALFLTQWAGVVLGVGAEVVILITYLTSLTGQTATTYDVARGARTVERLSLMAIIASGLAIVAFHVALGEADILFAPAFVTKWLLIAVVLFGYKLELWVDKQDVYGRGFVHGVVGGTWIAILILHVMAPDTTTPLLVGGYVVWMGIFGVVWSGFIAGLTPKPEAEFEPAPARYVPPELDEIEFEPKLEAVAASKPIPIVAPVPQPLVMPVVAAAPAPTKVVLPIASASVPSAPKVPPVAPTVPKPVAPALAPHPVVAALAPKPVQPVAAPHPVAAQPAPHPDDGLPSITVMPRTPEQVAGAMQF